MRYSRRLIAVGVPTGVYLLALVLPAVQPMKGIGWLGSSSGHDAFVVGYRVWFDLEDEDWNLERILIAASWLANFAIWAAILLLAFGRRRLAFTAGVTGCLLTLCALPYYWQMIIDQPGYWCWWGSAIAAILGSLLLYEIPQSSEADDYLPLSEAEQLARRSTVHHSESRHSL